MVTNTSSTTTINYILSAYGAVSILSNIDEMYKFIFQLISNKELFEVNSPNSNNINQTNVITKWLLFQYYWTNDRVEFGKQFSFEDGYFEEKCIRMNIQQNGGRFVDDRKIMYCSIKIPTFDDINTEPVYMICII